MFSGNRYQRLDDHADTGLGADEFEGDRRFTRPTDRIEQQQHDGDEASSSR